MSIYNTISDHKKRMLDWIKEMLQANKISMKWYIQGDTISTGGFVDLTDMDLQHVPFKFKRVDGHFKCTGNRFIDFNNFPDWIDGDLVLDSSMKDMKYTNKVVGKIIYK